MGYVGRLGHGVMWEDWGMGDGGRLGHGWWGMSGVGRLGQG